jgi:hypothetical protein
MSKKRKARKNGKKLTGKVWYTNAKGKTVKNPSVGGKAHYGPKPKRKVGKGASYKPKKATTKVGRKANRRGAKRRY